MSKVSDLAYEIVNPLAESLGLFVVEIEYKKQPDTGMNLTVFIDKEDGVSLDDCEALHRLIDDPLDSLDPTNGAPYILNVSSPGLDRPLKTEWDYKKNLGKELEVSLYRAIDGLKKFEASLVAFDEKTVTLSHDNKEIILEKTDVAIMKPAIKF